MIRFALAGAAVWAAERAVRWFVGSDPYEPPGVPRVTVTSDGITQRYGNGIGDELIGEDNYRDLGRGVLIDDLIGEME